MVIFYRNVLNVLGEGRWRSSGSRTINGFVPLRAFLRKITADQEVTKTLCTDKPDTSVMIMYNNYDIS